MSNHSLVTRTSRTAVDRASPDIVSGPHAASLSPPASGIEAADRTTPVVLQPKGDPRRGAETPVRPRPSSALSRVPPQLQAGIRALSGVDISDVRVHTNSNLPGRINALAFARGDVIHLAPSQEKHLPHEAWHIVQQRQGRVRLTSRLGGGAAINDDVHLEREADTMGRKADLTARSTTLSDQSVSERTAARSPQGHAVQTVVQRVIAANDTYMKDTGKKPLFGERFAFKHLLNIWNSNSDFLVNTTPIDKRGERDATSTPNTADAYAQAMSRFNSGASAAATHVLEPAVDPPRPGNLVTEKGGTVRYHPFDCVRAWKFARVDNDGAAPNRLKYEAQLVAVMSTPRTAKLSAAGTPGVVDHWDQTLNANWF